MSKDKYLFKVEWWNVYDDADETDYGIIIAESYVDAVHELTTTFSWINNISIEILDDGGEDIFWLNKENYDALRINNNYLNEGPLVTIEKCGCDIPVSSEEDEFFAGLNEYHDEDFEDDEC